MELLLMQRQKESEKEMTMKRQNKRQGKGTKEQSMPRILRQGKQPPCVETGEQCRGCFGWPNMMAAARREPMWRTSPLHCKCTGLTLCLEQGR